MPLQPRIDPSAAARRARAEQADPWVCHLVTPRRADVAPLDLCAAAAEAVCFLHDLCRVDREHLWAWEQWEQGSLRKVMLRGRAGEWAQAQEMFGATCTVGQASVRALVPVRRSERDPLLQRFQTQAGELPGAGDAMPVVDSALVVSVAADLGMSLGKACAQAAHAAGLAQIAPWDDVGCGTWRAAWEGACWPVVVETCDADRMQALSRREDVVVVHDAGLTEVAPLSLTACARPADR